MTELIHTFRQRLAEGGVIQVAGIRSFQEAQILVDCGADFLGFPLRLAYHSEDISDEGAREIIRAIPVPSVLITYLDNASEIIELSRQLGVVAVQLHGDISLQELSDLRESSSLGIIKSLVVRDRNRKELLRIVSEMAPSVDAFITDTFDPDTGACGATGKTHNWSVSRDLVETSPRPVILAGGLTPENVQAAVRCVAPAGVDVHTGVEDSTGAKCPDRMRAFAEAAALGFQSNRITP